MKNFASLLVLATALTACATEQSTEAAVGSEPNVENQPRVILHRAAGMVAPENTIPSLEEAVRQGADGVEIDVRQTRDGHLVLYHDDWIYREFGPGVKVEHLTLAEVARIDVGARWGMRFTGQRMPLLSDVFRFALENDLQLWLDVKTDGIYEDIVNLIEATGAQSVVINISKRPENDLTYAFEGPWIDGWNYLDGGEQDPQLIKEVAGRQADEPFSLMADDGRAWSMALGRSTDQPVSRYISTLSKVAARSITDGILSYTDGEGLSSNLAMDPRGALHFLARNPDSTKADQILAMARDAEEDPHVRLDAIWALGSLPNASLVPELEAMAVVPYHPDPENHPSGMGYFETFQKAAATAALARHNTAEAYAALDRIAANGGPFEREAVGLALAAFVPPGQADRLLPYLTSARENDGVHSFVLGMVGHLGVDAIPLYIQALEVGGMPTRMAVFGLAGLGDSSVKPLEELVADAQAPTEVRRQAALALYWNESEAAMATTGRLLGQSLPDPVLTVLEMSRS
ncbi:MAG: glycerophosphodiester phosphodiesterase [Fimbriimonadaceae bacterium]